MGNEDWNIVAALGQWAGAAATTAAVIVALAVSRAAHRVRFRVDVAVGQRTGPGLIVPGDGADSLFVNVINLSHKPAKLYKVALQLPDRTALFPKAWGPKVPATLDEGDGLSFDLSLAELAAGLRRSGFNRPIRLRVVVFSASGGTARAKFRFDPRAH